MWLNRKSFEDGGQYVRFEVKDFDGVDSEAVAVGTVEIRVDAPSIYILVTRIDESITGPVVLEVV